MIELPESHVLVKQINQVLKEYVISITISLPLLVRNYP